MIDRVFKQGGCRIKVLGHYNPSLIRQPPLIILRMKCNPSPPVALTFLLATSVLLRFSTLIVKLGQINREGGAFAYFARNINPAVVHLYTLLRNGQP